MSETQIALLAMAAVMIAAVWFFGRMQVRKVVKKDQPEQEGKEQPATPDKPVPPEPKPAVHRPVVAHKDPDIDRSVEVCARILRSTPFEGKEAVTAARMFASTGIPGLRIYALDAQIAYWCEPTEFSSYTGILAIAPKASRRGMLGEIEASKFATMAEQVALSLSAEIAETIDVAKAAAEAAELARVIEYFDMRVEVQVLFMKPVDAALFATAAKAAGFGDADDHFEKYLPQTGSRPIPYMLLTLSPDGLCARISLDAPVIGRSARPLAVLLATGNDLCARLSGVMADDRGYRMTSASAVQMAHQLDFYYDRMEDAGLSPGCERAARLFTGA